jgi:hypothetical protein
MMNRISVSIGYLASFFTALFGIFLLVRHGFVSAILLVVIATGCVLFVYQIPHKSISYRSVAGLVLGALAGLLIISSLGVVTLLMETGPHAWGPAAAWLLYFYYTGIFILVPATLLGGIMGLISGSSGRVKRIVFILLGMCSIYCFTTIVRHVYVWETFLSSPDHVPVFNIFSYWSSGSSIVFLFVVIFIMRMLDLSLSDWVIHMLLILTTLLLFAVPIYRSESVQVIDRIDGTTPGKAAESYLQHYTSENDSRKINKIDYSDMPSEFIRKRTGNELYFTVQGQKHTVGYLTVHPVKYQQKRIGWSVKQYKSFR